MNEQEEDAARNSYLRELDALARRIDHRVGAAWSLSWEKVTLLNGGLRLNGDARVQRLGAGFEPEEGGMDPRARPLRQVCDVLEKRATQ